MRINVVALTRKVNAPSNTVYYSMFIHQPDFLFITYFLNSRETRWFDNNGYKQAV